MIELINWNYEKLENMTEKCGEYNSICIDYTILAENFEQIALTLHENGEIIPLQFQDLNIACKGDLFKQINLPEIKEELITQKEEQEKIRNQMKIKHFARDLSHEEWFEFIDNEVLDFIEKYPEYAIIIKKD